MPGGHGAPLGLGLPRGQYHPGVATHGPEQEALARPTTAPYCPRGHQLQNPDPGGANVPKGHTVVVALGDTEPGAHAYPPAHCAVQVLDVRLDDDPYVP